MRMTFYAILIGCVWAGPALADDDTLRDLGTTAAPGEIPKFDGEQWRNAHDNVGVDKVETGVGLDATETNGTVRLTLLYPPVGSVVAWIKNHPGVDPNLPDGWGECNGQTLSDTNRPLHATTIPNLNGASSQPQRFLRGAQASGATGGSDQHQLTVAEMPSHSHSIALDIGSGGQAPSRPRREGYTDSVEGGHIGDTGGNQPHENRPPFFEVVWIMRVK